MKGRAPTEAQRRATMRNWRIRNLRALDALCRQLSGPRQAAARAAVDEELKLLGAETYAERAGRLHREWKELT